MTDAVAKALGIKDAEKLIDQSQAVMPIEDDTNLDAAAKFDIEAWAKKYGLNTIGKKSITEIPKQFLSK